jgi:ferrous iron transport protein A
MPSASDPSGSTVALDSLRAGDRAIIATVEAEGALGQRLADLGFLPGTPISLLRRAPLGDPISFWLRGCELCLRGREARTVRVYLS